MSANPAPFSGALAHQSVVGSSEHQHYFYNATTTLSISTGDTLYAYIYLDPANPPSELMLQWNDGSWEHRAYWGANVLGWGTDGTVSRRYMGVLPATGAWVRLAVPAVQVGLEGRTLNGMAFTLFGGRATWDRAGKTSAVPTTTTLVTSGTPSVAGANVTFTATATGTGPTGSVAFTDGGSAISGCSAAALPAGAASAKTATCSTSALSTGTHSIVATYSGDAGNLGSTSPALTQVVNSSGGGSDVIWVEDSVPAGATPLGDEPWNWIGSSPTPFAGALAHQSALASGEHQHYFSGASATLAVTVGDTLFAYVYLDPVNPPSEVMLQWNDGSWEHRAYWGANLIGWGTDGTVSRRYMGALPAPGTWVRLAVPASLVGLESRTLNGMAFTLYGGRAAWDHAGKATGGGSAATMTASNCSSRGDFNVDGMSDILWRRASDGTVTMSLMNGMSVISANLIGTGTDWSIACVGDFNGDGKADILWRRASDGVVLMSLMNGTTVISSSIVGSGTDWSIAGVGDFNGDGKGDILWRRASDGVVVMTLMNGMTVISSSIVGSGTDWSIAGVGDFNGDGKADILWRRASDGVVVMTLMNGTAAISSSIVGSGTDWSIAGVGDFNGDGKADILWRRASDGAVVMTLMNGFSVTSSGIAGSGTDWTVAGVGDFNGDGKADILWRRLSDGTVVMTLMNGLGVTSSGIVGTGTGWSVSAP